MELTTVDRAVQTGASDEDNLVQISSSLEQLLQRITSYQRYKRFQLDVSNQHATTFFEQGELAHALMLHILEDLAGLDTIQNIKGPLGKPLLPLEKFQRSLSQEQKSARDSRGASTTVHLLHLPKRISNIEQYLSINQGGSRPRDLLTRVAQLEMKLLALEGQSYEYNHHTKVGNKSVPQSTKINSGKET